MNFKDLNSDDIEFFRENLWVIRAYCGMSQEDLAKHLGVSRSTIVHMENTSGGMTKIQYFAIRWLLHELIYNCGDDVNVLLYTVVNDCSNRSDLSSSMREYWAELVFEKREAIGTKAGSYALYKALLDEWTSETREAQ